MVQVGSSVSIPKAVQDVRDLIKNLGKEIDVSSIREVLDAKMTNNVQTVFRSNMSEQNKEMWNNTPRNDPKRREWIMQYILDPTVCKCTGFNITKVVQEAKTNEEELWRTQEQLEGP